MVDALSGDAGAVEEAVDLLAEKLKASTASMTSVPKPMKFLSPHYDALRSLYADMGDFDPTKVPLAEVLSVLGMVNGAARRDTLRYCLLAGSGNITEWGHDYLRHLSGEIGATFDTMMSEDPEADVSD